jgi:hypothetical protein
VLCPRPAFRREASVLAAALVKRATDHDAGDVPVGLDRNGMAFGVQIVGPRGGDAYVLAVAAALEELLAGDVRTARPVPDISMLKKSPRRSARCRASSDLVDPCIGPHLWMTGLIGTKRNQCFKCLPPLPNRQSPP